MFSLAFFLLQQQISQEWRHRWDPNIDLFYPKTWKGGGGEGKGKGEKPKINKIILESLISQHRIRHSFSKTQIYQESWWIRSRPILHKNIQSWWWIRKPPTYQKTQCFFTVYYCICIDDDSNPFPNRTFLESPRQHNNVSRYFLSRDLA